MDHTKGETEVARWEAAFNLGQGSPTVDGTSLPVVSARHFAHDRLGWARPCIVALNNSHAFTDRYPEAYELVCQRVRSNFLGADNAKSRRAEIRVGIHIRRGDVTQSHRKRFTDTPLVAARIARVLDMLRPFGPLRALVFSQGDGDPDFEPLISLGCELRCDEDPVSSLRELARSDVLLTAKSSFSYVAGLVSAGTVLYEPFWHNKLPHWIGIDDTDEVRAALALFGRSWSELGRATD